MGLEMNDPSSIDLSFFAQGIVDVVVVQYEDIPRFNGVESIIDEVFPAACKLEADFEMIMMDLQG